MYITGANGVSFAEDKAKAPRRRAAAFLVTFWAASKK
jgi:hypothetical protein